MVTLNNGIKYDNCKDCISNCANAGKNREFVCVNGVSCKITGAETSGKEKSYSALIERLKVSAAWNRKSAEWLEQQHDLNDYEKRLVLEYRAIAAQLEKIIRVEAQL